MIASKILCYLTFFSYASTHNNCLRKHLINNTENRCIICKSRAPIYLLECAHIKPRSVSNEKERNDTGIVS